MSLEKLAEQANGRFEQAWPGGVIWYWDELVKFAELVAAHKREELLDIVYGYANHLRNDEAFQEAIRARGKS